MSTEAKTSDSATLAKQPAGPVEIDPVCEMELPREAASIDAYYESEHLYFCCEACKRRFEQEPARYSVSYVELA